MSNNAHQSNDSQFAHKINSVFAEFLTSNPSSHDLGPAFETMDVKEAESALQLYRMHKNFQQPSIEDDDKREKASVEAAFLYDGLGPKTFHVNQTPGAVCPFVKRQLYLARSVMRESVSTYHFRCSDLELPSGETYVSSGGDVSIYAKFRDIDQITVTEDCFDLFARVCFNSSILRKVIKRHYRLMNAPAAHIPIDIWNRVLRSEVQKTEDNLDSAYTKGRKWFAAVDRTRLRAFKVMLRAVCTIVRGGRMVTVPKDNTVDRVIICEPLGNMIVQRVIGISLRRIILTKFGIDLTLSQIAHQALLADENNVTIDLKNASNSVFTAVVDWFLGGTAIHKHLMAARSPYVKYDGQWRKLNMLSAMGNGFTFEVMTFILLCISREYDSCSYVYGDDIIVDRDVAQPLIATLGLIRFAENPKKTFLQGNFRESCGAFTCKGIYLTSFKFEWCVDDVDAITLVNKVAVLAYTSRTQLTTKLRALHQKLIECVPPVCLRGVTFKTNFAGRKFAQALKTINLSGYNKGPLCEGNDAFSLTKGCYVPYRLLAEKHKKTSWYRETLRFRDSSLFKDLQLGGESWDPTYVLVKRANTYLTESGRPLNPIDNVSHLFGLYYIWIGRVAAPELRSTYVSRQWDSLPPLSVG